MGFFSFLQRAHDHQAHIMPVDTFLTVEASANLLAAALNAGLNWKHDCRVGSCGTCRCRLVKGKVKALSDFSYVLTGDELKDGMILACQCALRSDIEVEVELEKSARDVPITSNIGKVKRAKNLTHDILEIVIQLDKNIARTAIAGQYAEVSTPAVKKPRSYSFAKAPEDEKPGEVTFFVRLVPGGEFTEWLFAEDRIGEPMTVTGPYGSFWLRADECPILCIAGGSGLAPIKALLENAANVGVTRDVLFLFGARTEKDLYCLNVIKNIKKRWKGKNFHFEPVLSEEPMASSWQGARGMVTDYLVSEYLKNQGVPLSDCHAYLCGPPPMIDAAIAVLHKQSVSDDVIFFDKFLDASSMPGGRK